MWKNQWRTWSFLLILLNRHDQIHLLTTIVKVANAGGSRKIKSLQIVIILSDKDAWTQKRSATEAKQWLEASTTSRNAQERKSKLKALHTTDTRLQNGAKNKIFYLFDKLQTYNQKKAAGTENYARCMDALLKAYNLDDKDLITKFRFLAPLRRACDMNGVPEAWHFGWCLQIWKMEQGPD